MERLRHMSLRRAYFLLTLGGLLAGVALAALLWTGCTAVSSQYPSGGVMIGSNGAVMSLPAPTPEQMGLLRALDVIGLLGWVLFPAAGLGLAGTLFYRWKLRDPIRILLEGTRRIRAHDLDFTIPAPSADELGQICAAFEGMRAELLKTNRELWRQAEERKRLNAAFAHDLRNPVTVLKGSAKLLRQDPADRLALDRLERYTLRIEQYVEAMSSIQRLEQMPVRTGGVSWALLGSELEETARLLAPALDIALSVPEEGAVRLDHGIFLTVTENLIGNGARFAQRKLELLWSRRGTSCVSPLRMTARAFPPDCSKAGRSPSESWKRTRSISAWAYTAATSSA